MDAASIKDTVTSVINAEPLARIDYVEIVSWDLLEPVKNIDGPVLVAVAVFIGKTRLIDNFIALED